MKKILIMICASFTAINLCFIIFSRFDIVPKLTNQIALQLFVITVTIAVLMYAGEYLETKIDLNSLIIDMLLRITICYLVIFCEGSFFGMVKWEWGHFFDVSCVLVPTFIVTYIISYLTCVDYANSINKKINNRKVNNQ